MYIHTEKCIICTNIHNIGLSHAHNVAASVRPPFGCVLVYGVTDVFVVRDGLPWWYRPTFITSSRRFEPWWPWELRLLKFFVIIIILICIFFKLDQLDSSAINGPTEQNTVDYTGRQLETYWSPCATFVIKTGTEITGGTRRGEGAYIKRYTLSPPEWSQH